VLRVTSDFCVLPFDLCCLGETLVLSLVSAFFSVELSLNLRLVSAALWQEKSCEGK